MAEITKEEWLAELLALQRCGPSDDGLTIQEMADATGKSRDWLLKKLQLAQKAGILKVGRRTVKDITGAPRERPCYRIVER